MKVKELIAALLECDMKADVEIETRGCDVGIEYVSNARRIILIVPKEELEKSE